MPRVKKLPTAETKALPLPETASAAETTELSKPTRIRSKPARLEDFVWFSAKPSTVSQGVTEKCTPAAVKKDKAKTQSMPDDKVTTGAKAKSLSLKKKTQGSEKPVTLTDPCKEPPSAKNCNGVKQSASPRKLARPPKVPNGFPPGDSHTDSMERESEACNLALVPPVGKDFLAKLQKEPETLVKKTCEDRSQTQPGFKYLYTPRLNLWFRACQQLYQTKLQKGRVRALTVRDIPGGQELHIERSTNRHLNEHRDPGYALLRFNYTHSILSLYGTARMFTVQWKMSHMPALLRMVEKMDGGVVEHIEKNSMPREKVRNLQKHCRVQCGESKLFCHSLKADKDGKH